jgi:hypothetical protein
MLIFSEAKYIKMSMTLGINEITCKQHVKKETEKTKGSQFLLNIHCHSSGFLNNTICNSIKLLQNTGFKGK